MFARVVGWGCEPAWPGTGNQMKNAIFMAAVVLVAAGCATDQKLASAREWQRAECNRIIDNESRDRCMRRVDDDFGRAKEEAARDKKR